jgi:hypothetical protein
MVEIRLTNIEEELIRIITKYQATAQYACSILRDQIKSGDSFLRAKVSKQIPHEGFIDDLFYSFHGTGCYFELKSANINLDVDFGPNDRCDGFDLSRICNFYENFSVEFPHLVAEGNIETGFFSLVKKNVIYNPNWLPNDHLFYFVQPVIKL